MDKLQGNFEHKIVKFLQTPSNHRHGNEAKKQNQLNSPSSKAFFRRSIVGVAAPSAGVSPSAAFS